MTLLSYQFKLSSAYTCYKATTNLLKVGRVPRSVLARHLWSDYFGRQKVDERILARDGIDSKEYRHIYQTTSTVFFNYAQIGCITSFLTFGSLALYNCYSFPLDTPTPSFETPTQMIMAYCGIFSFNLAIVYLLSSFPIRMYYSENQNHFVFVYKNIFLPWKTNTSIYKCGDLQHLESEGKAVNMFGNHMIQGKRVYVYESYFRYPVYYNLLLGYENRPLT